MGTLKLLLVSVMNLVQVDRSRCLENVFTRENPVDTWYDSLGQSSPLFGQLVVEVHGSGTGVMQDFQEEEQGSIHGCG
jgi:hypothetical protein